MIENILQLLAISLPFCLAVCILSYAGFIWEGGDNIWLGFTYFIFFLISCLIVLFICGFTIVKYI